MSTNTIVFQKFRVEQSRDSNADFDTYTIDEKIFSQITETTGYMGHGKMTPIEHFMSPEAFQKIQAYIVEHGLKTPPPKPKKLDEEKYPLSDMVRFQGYSLQIPSEKIDYRFTDEGLTSEESQEFMKKLGEFNRFISAFTYTEKLKLKVWTDQEREDWRYKEKNGHAKGDKPQSVLQFDFYRYENTTQFRVYMSGDHLQINLAEDPYATIKYDKVPKELMQTLTPLFVESQLYEEGDHNEYLSAKDIGNAKKSKYYLDMNYGLPWKNRIRYEFTYYPGTEPADPKDPKFDKAKRYEELEKKLQTWLKNPELEKYKSK